MQAIQRVASHCMTFEKAVCLSSQTIEHNSGDLQ